MKKENIIHVHCPVNGWDCPNYVNFPFPCACTLADPWKDCDDFATFWNIDDNYWCFGECLE